MSGVWDYFSSEQKDRLLKKIEQVNHTHGPEQVKRWRVESEEAIQQLRAGMETGLPADDPKMATWARRLATTQAMFNDEDAEMEEAIERFHIEHPDQKDHGIDLNLYRYIETVKSLLSAK